MWRACSSAKGDNPSAPNSDVDAGELGETISKVDPHCRHLAPIDLDLTTRSLDRLLHGQSPFCALSTLTFAAQILRLRKEVGLLISSGSGASRPRSDVYATLACNHRSRTSCCWVSMNICVFGWPAARRRRASRRDASAPALRACALRRCALTRCATTPCCARRRGVCGRASGGGRGRGR